MIIVGRPDLGCSGSRVVAEQGFPEPPSIEIIKNASRQIQKPAVSFPTEDFHLALVSVLIGGVAFLKY